MACARSLLTRQKRRPAAGIPGRAVPATQALAAGSIPARVADATLGRAAGCTLGRAADFILVLVVACTQALAAGSIPGPAAGYILGRAGASILDHPARTDIVVHGALASRACWGSSGCATTARGDRRTQ